MASELGRQEVETAAQRQRRTGDFDLNGVPDHLEGPSKGDTAAAEFKARYLAEIRAANAAAEQQWKDQRAVELATRQGRFAEAALEEDRFRSAGVALAEASAVAKHYAGHSDVYKDVTESYAQERPRELQDLVDEREMKRVRIADALANLQSAGAEAEMDADYDVHTEAARKELEEAQQPLEWEQDPNSLRSQVRADWQELRNREQAIMDAQTSVGMASDQEEVANYTPEQQEEYGTSTTMTPAEAAASREEAEAALAAAERSQQDFLERKGIRLPAPEVDEELEKSVGELEQQWAEQRIEAKEISKAAEYEAMQADPEHQAALEEHLQEELQRTLDRRQQLAEEVAAKSDQINQVVDQLHDPKADESEVARAYEAAAKEYAQATQAEREFEAQPSRDLDVVADYRELQRIEQRLIDEAKAAERARAEGLDEKVALTHSNNANVASLEREDFLKERGISPDTPMPESTRNEIERPLPDEKVQALMSGAVKPSKAKSEEQEAEVEETARQALAARAAQDMARPDNQVRDQSAFADVQDKSKLMPPEVASHWKQDGNKFRDQDDPKKVAFVDKGNRLQTIRTFDDRAVEDMIAVADARGWTEVKVSGDEAFRRKAWIEAAARGLEVKGYQPTEQDKARAEDLGKRTGRANTIEKNETLEAYRAARDGSPKDKAAAAKKHPELTKAFALEAASRSFAKQRLNKDDQERFVDRTRENIERDLAQGKQIPEVRRRMEQERRQDRGQER